MVLGKMRSVYRRDLSVTDENEALYNEDADTGYEGPGDQDPVFSSDRETDTDDSFSDRDTEESYCSDSDSDAALRYCHKDEVAYRRSNGLEFHEESGAGFWYTPSGVRFFDCYQRPKGVVFEEDL